MAVTRFRRGTAALAIKNAVDKAPNGARLHPEGLAMAQLSSCTARLVPILCLLATTGLSANGARALEEKRGEVAAIEACDKRLCAILVQKNAKGDDLKCSLTKTWARSTIKEADSQKLSWNFGDAQCSVEVNLSRASLISALTEDRRKLRLEPHTVNCVVEQNGKLEKVTATAAPKIEFRDGKADKIWINLKDVEGPAGIKATIHAAASLADTLGLFHKRMLKSVNRYIERHCPKTYPQLVASTPPAASVKPKADKK